MNDAKAARGAAVSGRSSGRRYTAMGLVLGAAVALVASVATADAQPRHEERGRFDRRHEVERHREPDRHRNVDWRFERGRGWHYRPGFGAWSPYYAWWLVNRQVVMLAEPTVTVVDYPTGRYVLRGDGIYEPYYWAWIPARAVIAAPPPPPLGAAPPGSPYPPPAPPPPPPMG